MMGFDFGDLSEDSQEGEKIGIEGEVKQIVKSLGLKRAARNEAAKVIREVEGDLKEWFRGELSTYKKSLKELWDEIFPTLVKMWGLRSGIGARVSKINQIISDETLNKAG